MDNIKAVCNWTRIGGCDWEKAIQTKLIDDEIEKPEIDDILHDESAVLLRRKMKVESEEEAEPCELQLKVFPRFKVSALNIICTVPKIEVFLGAQDEYYETEHGHLLEQEDFNMDGQHSYRYDIEIEKSGISELTLKLLTNAEEICIFAILLQIAPNPNGITTLLPTGINIENVQKMLENSSQKLTPNAEKCKKLLEMCSKAPATSTTSAFKQKPLEGVFAELQIHIDKQLQDMESRVMRRLEAMEAQQAAKFDEILKAIQASRKD